MSTNNTNVTYTKLVSATYHADNSSQAECAYNIAADIQVNGNAVTSVSNGTIASRSSNGGSGSFGADANSSHFDFYGINSTVEQVTAVQAVRAFIDGAAASVPTDPANV